MDVIYEEAGHIELVRLSDGKRFLKTGVVQSISLTPTNNVVTVIDGNCSYDMLFSIGKVVNVNITLNSFQPKLHSALSSFKEVDPQAVTSYVLTMGGGVIPLVDILDVGTMRIVKEYGIPPSQIVTLPKTPLSPADIVIHNENGVPFLYTEDEPQEGEFSVAD